MWDVYTRFGCLLQQHFPGSPGAGGISNAASSSCMSSGGLPSSVAAVPAGPAEGGNSSSTDSTAWAAARALASQHITAAGPEEALKQAEALWPAWSRACCRLLPEPPLGQANKAPTASAAASAATEAAAPAVAPAAAQPWPEEAAVVLQQVAQLALALPKQKRQRLLARNRVVKGLVQALRLLTPPPPGQHTPAPVGHAEPAATGAQPTAGSSSGSSLAGSGPAVRAALWALAVLGGSAYWQEEAEALCTMLPTCGFARVHHVSAPLLLMLMLWEWEWDLILSKSSCFLALCQEPPMPPPAT
jgi:hypothetical protein